MHRFYDRLVDDVTDQSERFKHKALKHTEKLYPLQRLKHNLHVIDFLADRLALAEHCLKKGWGFPRYCYFLRKMGLNY